MPILRVELLAGRTNEVKESLAEKLTQVVVETLHVSPEKVRVLLYEVEKEHWFVGGRSYVTRDIAAPTTDTAVSGQEE